MSNVYRKQKKHGAVRQTIIPLFSINDMLKIEVPRQLPGDFNFAFSGKAVEPVNDN